VAVRDDPNAATIMPLVQTASTLPMLHRAAEVICQR
jgi:hypothetical protein